MTEHSTLPAKLLRETNTIMGAVIDGTPVVITPQLLTSYDRFLPRYTSYPTAPAWKNTIDARGYEKALASFKGDTLSLYIHLPFCAARCTFCACNVVVTSKQSTIDAYIDAVETELARVEVTLGRPVAISQLHLGGGTPNYLDESQMTRVMNAVTNAFTLTPDAEVSIEIDPRFITPEKLLLLKNLCFNRLSFGVQDVDPYVQQAIGRVEPLEDIKKHIDEARHIGFEGINVDLVYGLPLQELSGWKQTLDAVIGLDPDRIALFNFAFVPWMQPHQRKISGKDFPVGMEKLALFTTAIERFSEAKYEFIGLDHFAKNDDELAKARQRRTLARNFQGYTARGGLELVGVGMSAIGDISGCFVQNEHKLIAYEQRIAAGELATARGHMLTPDDELRRWVIGELFCHQQVKKSEFAELWDAPFDQAFVATNPSLQTMQDDGLITNTPDTLIVTPLGRIFIRNIGAVFDHHLTQGANTFSRVL